MARDLLDHEVYPMEPTHRVPGLPLVGAVVLAACIHPQRPYVFNEGVAPERATQIMVSALAAEGLPAATVDSARGLIVTSWADTGYRFRENAPYNEAAIDVERTVFRRYHVFVAPDVTTGRTTVRLQTEAKRCTPDVTVRNDRLLGDCQDVERFFPGLQDEMDELGEKLRQIASLHSQTPPATPDKSVAQSGP